ncbi:MAG: lipid-A-disaccharide synthase N-terminal domain-containing protein [Alphaproteobacteria bacterium]|nr:lipid-A-disaccharide synthase N-terminal domain-containing protein [Alphaproteobacteria bacterium]
MSWIVEWVTRAVPLGNPYELAWAFVGVAAQMLFFMRWILQGIASEKAGRSVVPLSFWYVSFGAGLVLLAYGIYKHEPIIVIAQAAGTVMYARNLWLIYRERRRSGEAFGTSSTAARPGGDD